MQKIYILLQKNHKIGHYAKSKIAIENAHTVLKSRPKSLFNDVLFISVSIVLALSYLVLSNFDNKMTNFPAKNGQKWFPWQPECFFIGTILILIHKPNFVILC